jgi:hypothetical protein
VWRRLVAVLVLVVTITVGCDSAPSNGPSAQSSEVTWVPVPLAAPNGPTSGTQIGRGLHGILAGGGSQTGAWLNLLDGQRSVRIAEDVLAALPDVAALGGIASFGGTDYALAGSTIDGAARTPSVDRDSPHGLRELMPLT